MNKEKSKAIDLSQLDILSRRKCIEELYQLGLSLRAIAEYTTITFTTVSNDSRHIQLNGKVARPNSKRDAFKVQFLYFERFLKGDSLEFSKCEAVMHATLAHVLMIDTLSMQLYGVAETLRRLAIPGMTPEQAPYYALFARHVFQSTRERISTRDILESYYAATKENESLLPDSYDQLFRAIADWYVAQDRTYVMPILPSSFLDDAASVISSLSAREREVLIRRFGLANNRPEEFREIGSLFGVTQERVRQIEASAIRKLKNYGRYRILSKYFLSLANAFQSLEDEKEELKRQQSELQRQLKELHRGKTTLIVNKLASSPDSILLESIGYLELSTRSHKCLTRINISTIGDLIKCSETELMDIRNFGRTSLRNVKNKLAAYGLLLQP